ncbi:hypothetical protein P7C71_g731, partial [Lecanoromycetidae sp. Uapishka_2]
MEFHSTTLQTLQRRAATSSYVTVFEPPPTTTASSPISSASRVPTVTQHPSSSVAMGTFIGVLVALLIVILMLSIIAVYFFMRPRKLERNQPLRSSPRAGISSNPKSRTGTGSATRQPTTPMAPPIRPYGPSTVRVNTPTKPSARSETNRRDVASPYSNRSHTPTIARAATASPTTPTRARVPTPKRSAPSITVSSAPQQKGSPYDELREDLKVAPLQGHTTSEDVRKQLERLQLLSDTTDMSVDTMVDSERLRPVVNARTERAIAKAIAQGKDPLFLGSDASECDPVSQPYEENAYGPSGRSIQGARTWETNGSGVTVPRSLTGQDRSQKSRPLMRN